MNRETVFEKLNYARNRLDKIIELYRFEVFFNDPQTRQRVSQEFFFHLTGAVEYLMQYINIQLELEINEKSVTPFKMIETIKVKDKSHNMIRVIELFSNNIKECIHLNSPYSNKGMVSRLYVYRNRVAHRGMNPYNIMIADGISAHLFLDPENPELGNSKNDIIPDLTEMFELVWSQIHEAIDMMDAQAKKQQNR
jgi:hypothetical protein